jgi:hypothetical protein
MYMVLDKEKPRIGNRRDLNLGEVRTATVYLAK